MLTTLLRLSSIAGPLAAFAFLAGCGNGGGGSSANVQMDVSITSSQCVVTVGYTGEAVVELGEIVLDYSSAAGNFGQEGYTARCRSLIDDATRSLTFNRCESTTCEEGEDRSLYMTFSMGQIQDDLFLHTPADLFECFFEGDGVTLANLGGEIRLTGPTLNETHTHSLEARVECDGWPVSTTTTSTTTSTLPCEGLECGEGDVIPLELWLDDDVTLGSLQISVEFSSVTGGFDQLAASNVRCTMGAGVNALFATNQTPHINDASCEACTRVFAAGFVFSPGYTGPGRLMSCDFVVGQQLPTANDFSISVVDASTVHTEPVDPFPNVSLRGFPGE